jgi:RecA-family ATPase
MLNMNSSAWIAGPPGSYKTFLALDWALSVAAGSKYMGRDVNGGRVLYVAGEGVSGLYQRADAWQQANRVTVEHLYILPEAVPVGLASWVSLCDLARGMEARMVILDTQARMCGSLDENSAPDMGKYVNGIDALKNATGGCVVSIHHSSKSGSALRGSSAVQGAADTIYTVETREGTVGVHNLKQKDMAQSPDYWMRPAQTAESCVLVECEKPQSWDAVKHRKAYGGNAE